MNLDLQKGDLNSVMAAYPHVADWVRDFESRYGCASDVLWSVGQRRQEESPIQLDLHGQRANFYSHIRASKMMMMVMADKSYGLA